MRKANLISDHQMQLLRRIEGRVDLYFTPIVPGAFPYEVVFVNKAINVAASLDYEDLDFKFEYFFFQLKPFSGELGKKIGATVVRNIRCIFRCEWKYDEGGKKVVFGRGKIDDVSDNAIACCSNVGFLILSDDDSRILVYSDDDFPLSVGVTKEDTFIDAYLKQCVVVDIEDVSEFSEKLVAKGFDINGI